MHKRKMSATEKAAMRTGARAFRSGKIADSNPHRRAGRLRLAWFQGFYGAGTSAFLKRWRDKWR